MHIITPQVAERLRSLWSSRPVAPISYATVREFCEYADVCPELFAGCQDLKDAQRAWAVKAILACVPPGGSLVEIGGGQPTVAQSLIDLGYSVTVVDPYDGSGNGPVEYDSYRSTYPAVRFLRSLFTSQCPIREASLDGVYSVSVIEHVPIDDLAGLFSAMRKFLKPGGASIHCIDVVLKGWMTEYMRSAARVIMNLQHGLTQQTELAETEVYDELATRMESDLETFFLSAHGHNLWRNHVPYDRYSFRRVGSMQLSGNLPA